MKRIIRFIDSISRKVFITAAFVWAAVILVLMLMPGQDLPKVQLWNVDKLVHMGVFFFLAFLVWKSLAEPDPGYQNNKKLILPAVLYTTLYGTVTELLQLTAVNRSADIYDIIANTLGAMIFLFFARLWLKALPMSD